MKNYICIDGKKAELTEEQLKALGIEIEKKSPFKRDLGLTYYHIMNTGKLAENTDNFADLDNEKFKVANYCTDENLMKQRALKETLSRLLWRFSMENGGDKIDWNDNNHNKYKIWLEIDSGDFEVGLNSYYKEQGTEYFISEEIAQKAIDEIVIPFMQEHPEFVW